MFQRQRDQLPKLKNHTAKVAKFTQQVGDTSIRIVLESAGQNQTISNKVLILAKSCPYYLNLILHL